jgi:hypothetical protein
MWAARSELGINLMRLGEEDEPKQLLERVTYNGQTDAATVEQSLSCWRVTRTL